jgi:ribose-phosphate pyrophosphokinase
MNFKLICTTRNNYEIKYSRKTFAGGEVQVKLLKYPVGDTFGPVLIDGLIKSSDMLMELLLLANALHHSGKSGKISANIHYLPYARQDRICTLGESFALENFMHTLTNSCLEHIIVEDVHSDVAILLANKIHSGGCWSFISQTDIVSPHIPQGVTLISPDKGALRKTIASAIATDNNFVTFNKVRDPHSGSISGTEIIDGEEFVDGKVCLILDDILDGGRTFVPIIEKLFDKGAKAVYLYATHAILPYGLDAVMNVGCDGVFYKNSFRDDTDGELFYHVSKMKSTLEEKL